MKKLTALLFAVCVAFVAAAEAQKKPAAKPFTTSGYYNGITVGPESGDPGGMSVFLTESDGQLYALVMTAAGDFFAPVLVEAKQSGKDMRTVEFALPEPSNFNSRTDFKGIVSAKNLTIDAAEGSEKMTLKRDCGSLYSNIAVGAGGDYGGMEVFLYDMAGDLYALVTVAEGVMARPVIVKTEPKRDRNLMVQSFTFTLPDSNRKFTGKLAKTGLTLTENGKPMTLKDKCYK